MGEIYKLWRDMKHDSDLATKNKIRGAIGLP